MSRHTMRARRRDRDVFNPFPLLSTITKREALGRARLAVRRAQACSLVTTYPNACRQVSTAMVD